ncbi:hypothetical protein BDZ88DRAFT_424331 [Geranomyces variabilis]|nr:hypothetical protein BDZ88DRAFT_424331 [Geranomyces variabilis]
MTWTLLSVTIAIFIFHPQQHQSSIHRGLTTRARAFQPPSCQARATWGRVHQALSVQHSTLAVTSSALMAWTPRPTFDHARGLLHPASVFLHPLHLICDAAAPPSAVTVTFLIRPACKGSFLACNLHYWSYFAFDIRRTGRQRLKLVLPFPSAPTLSLCPPVLPHF